MTSILVAVPVLNRPERAQLLVDSVAAASSLDVRVMFLCSFGDSAEAAACKAAFSIGKPVVVVVELPFEAGPGDYARKINRALDFKGDWWSTDYILMAADDLAFHPGWDTAAVACAEASGAGVIGTNDLGNNRVTRGEHSTHPLVARWYIDRHGTIDEAGKMLHEGYDHNYVDDELVGTAKARGLWSFCDGSVVEHLHPNWRKAEWDGTYSKGQARFAEDAVLFRNRERLWA